ncbi:MAG: TonB-dependent receptor, partial [Bacteroidota bacterium]
MLALLLLFFSLPLGLLGQDLVQGTVENEESGEELVGARIIIEGTRIGSMSREDGSFSFRPGTQPPFVLMATFLGYDTLRLEVNSLAEPVNLQMTENFVTLGEVNIFANAALEKQKQADLTLETMSITAIKETPAANFYEGLGHLKGVDLSSASFGFKVVNTRGFNSTQPVRSLQLIDGVDNQSPGLNFSLGNFLGASELDIESVDLVVGASSAFYGPNAFNGVISMTTKDPFIHQGVSASVKLGERNWVEGGIRVARAFGGTKGNEKFAFKLNLFYLQADDWVADNMDEAYRDTSERRAIPYVGEDNPGGYDAVNRYGDENLKTGQNSATSGSEQILLPGLGRWHRTGYEERDLVDYNTNNFKGSLALHYKVRPKVDLIASTSYSNGTTVFQGINRISLKDIQFFQHKVELREKEKFFFRVYMTHENAGNSYDPVFTAFQLQELGFSDRAWDQRYRNYWRNNFVDDVESLEGYPEEPNFQNGFLFDFEQQARILDENNDKLTQWHQEARTEADEFYARPGTPEFQALFDSITSTPLNSTFGTRFVDRSALYHGHGEYKFKPQWAEVTVGGNFRLYTPVTDGTIFEDTAGNVITNFEYGLYTGVKKRFADDRLTTTATLRMDKNQNFRYLFSPALTAVWRTNKQDVIRASFSSAIRNPTLSDQYLNYNVGRATLVGNIEGRDSLLTLPSLDDFFDTNDLSQLEYFSLDPIQPERVRTFEVGYRTTIAKRLYIDAGYYFSLYRDFIGYRLGFDGGIVFGIPVGQVLRVSANATDVVTTQGFSIGANYFFDKGYAVSGNYSWNRLNTATDDPIIPAFNTPEHKFNVSFSGRNIEVGPIDKLGFNVNYKWVQGFLFEGSPQFTGEIPTYYLLD